MKAVIGMILSVAAAISPAATPSVTPCLVFGYYDADGQFVARPSPAAPLVDGTRVSDEFRLRFHPVYHRWLPHTGVDVAAPFGSAIRAAADGTVVEAGVKGVYGIYVRLYHGSSFETAYAHGSRLPQGIQPGAHVRRGQTILFVGHSGVTDGGNHTHFEMLLSGKRVRPAVACSSHLPTSSPASPRSTLSARNGDAKPRHANSPKGGGL